LVQAVCQACILNQAAHAAAQVGLSLAERAELLDMVEARLIAGLGQPLPPLEDELQRQIRDFCGGDPYAQIKRDSTRQALELLPYLQDIVRAAPRPLETALRLAIAGNIIDMATHPTYDLRASLVRSLDGPLAIDHSRYLAQRLELGGPVLYLADNAGETVFDRVLIETLARPVPYVVKGGIVFNDATRADALAAGLPAARLIDNGSDHMGTDVEAGSPEFQEAYRQAGLIISKGQANLVSLTRRHDHQAESTFFLLQTKCATISAWLGLPVGSAVVLNKARMK